MDSLVHYQNISLLVDLFNSWSTCWICGWRSSSCTAHTSHTTHIRHSTRHATSCACHGLKDWVGNCFQRLLLLFVFFLFGRCIRIQPDDGLFNRCIKLGLVICRNLVLHFVRADRTLQTVTVVLKRVLGFNSVLVGVIFCLVFLGFFHHALNFFLGQTTLVVRDGNLLFLIGRFLQRGHVQNTVGVNIKTHVNLRLTARHRRDSVQVEFTQQVVISCHRTLSLKHLNQHTRLVVCVRRESLRLLRW